MGISPMPARVYTSCASVLDRLPVVVHKEVHCDHNILDSFAHLFAPVHAQDAQIRRAAHRVLPAALLLLKQYHNMIILMLQKE
jgi:hypothetical protein